MTAHARDKHPKDVGSNLAVLFYPSLSFWKFLQPENPNSGKVEVMSNQTFIWQILTNMHILCIPHGNVFQEKVKLEYSEIKHRLLSTKLISWRKIRMTAGLIKGLNQKYFVEFLSTSSAMVQCVLGKQQACGIDSLKMALQMFYLKGSTFIRFEWLMIDFWLGLVVWLGWVPNC